MSTTAQLIMNPSGVISIDSGIFTHRAPKPAGVHAVRLTAQNLDRVAEHFRAKLKDQVTASDDYIAIGDLTIPAKGYPVATGVVFHLGDWIIEKYNYTADYAYFVKATAAEREKYDLR